MVHISQNSWYKLNLALGITAEEDQKCMMLMVVVSLSYSDWMTKLSSLI